MLAASRRPHNPNKTTDDIGWDSGDLSSFLTGVDINGKFLLKNDTKLSNKSIDFYQTAPKRVLVAEIIRTFNHNQLNLLNGIFHIQKCNDRLINYTKNKNKTFNQLNHKIKHLEASINTLYSLIFRAKHPLPAFATQNDVDNKDNPQTISRNPCINIPSQTNKIQIINNTTNKTEQKINNITKINTNDIIGGIAINESPKTPLKRSQLDKNINTNSIHTQTLLANPRLLNSEQKVNKNTNNNTLPDLSHVIPTVITESLPKQSVLPCEINNNIKPMKIIAGKVDENKMIKKINNQINIKSPSADSSLSVLNNNNIKISNPCIISSPDLSHEIVRANPRIINTSLKINSKKKSMQNKLLIPRNNPSPNPLRENNKLLKTRKKRKKNNNNNKSNNKIKKHRKKKQKSAQHSGYAVSNNSTSMKLPYIPNKQRKQRYSIINPIRKDIAIKTRYGIYHNSKCLELQIQDILPYEEYIKDEQQAYDELNEQINYAVYNR